MRTIGNTADSRAEIGQHFLGVVARGFRFNHDGTARRIQPRQQDRGFELRRGHRRAVFDGGRLRRARDRDRAAPALRLRDDLHAHQRQRIEDAPHRAFAQRRIAVKRGGDRVAAHKAHHQPRAGACIAKIENFFGGEQRADAAAVHLPFTGTEAFDAGAQRAAGGSGAQHVVAFQQALDIRAPLRQQAQDERTMGDRLVAGRTQPAIEGAAGGGSQWLRGAVASRRGGACAISLRGSCLHGSSL